MAIEHLSPSTVQSYRTCGKQVYFNKILGIENPQKYAMTVYGSVMHKAIECLYKDKLSEQDFCKKFIEEFTDKSTSVTNWKTDTATSLTEQGVIACKDFYKNIYGKYDVAMTEKKFEIKRGEGSLPILCFADAITKDKVVIDYKFGRGLTGMADSRSYDCNMATYAWAYEQENGILPDKIVLIKEKWRYNTDRKTHERKYYHDSFVIEEAPIFTETVDFYKDVYNNVEIGIQAGVWLPATDDSFFCQSCGYRVRGICKKDVKPKK